MKKFNMQGAQYKGEQNPVDVAERLSQKKLQTTSPTQVTMITLDKDSELPPALEPLRGMIEKINPDSPVTMPEKQWKKLAKWAKGSRTGGGREIPMRCMGTMCEYHKQCPLMEAGLQLNAFQPCPLEEHLLEQWNEDMAASIMVKPGEVAYAPDLRTINHSSMLEILVRRNSMELATDPAIIQNVVMGVDPRTGEPIYGKQVNQRVTEAQKLVSTEEKLHSSLLATRKSKAAAGKKIQQEEEEYLAGAAEFAEAKEAEVVENANKPTGGDPQPAGAPGSSEGPAQPQQDS